LMRRNGKGPLSPAPQTQMEVTEVAFGKLWSRIVGLKGWDEEVRALHNVEGDETPAPGTTSEMIVEDNRPGELIADDAKTRYDEWPGIDPGH
jgi:hypothetical protein